MTFISDEQLASANIHVGDTGTIFLATVYKQDGTVLDTLGDATDMELILTNPSGVSSSHVPLLYTDGTDGKLYYELADGDIDMKGKWSYQIKLEFATKVWRTTVVNFTVSPNLPDVIVPAP